MSDNQTQVIADDYDDGMIMRPVGRWLTLHKEKPVSVDGLLVPELHRVQKLRFTVLAKGPDVAIDVNAGDSVYLRPGSPGIGYHPANDDYWLIEEEFVVGVIEKDYHGLIMQPKTLVVPSG